MPSVANLTPAELSVIKSFAYALRSAPTRDLLSFGVDTLRAGGTPAALTEFLFNVPVPQSPFTAYRNSASNLEFVTALVDNLTVGTTIGSATKAAWTAELVPLLATFAHRGDFVITIYNLIDGYAGTVPELVALKAELASRVEKSAAFLDTPGGQAYNGQGFTQLLAPLLPPPPVPTYELTVNAPAVNEGGAVTFTLQTTHVAAGTVIGFNLSGNGITTSDVIGGQLAGSLLVGANGSASVTVTFTNDVLSEGTETLRMTLAGNRGQVEVVVNDTSVGQPLPGTFALAASAIIANEGTTVTYTLTTSGVPAGTFVPYLLVGAGISAADVVGNLLAGGFVVNDQGTASAIVQLANDATTEGFETVRMRLDNGTFVDVAITDTSVGGAPVGTADTIVVADQIVNSGARPPLNSGEGEMTLDSYLNYDLLNQSGSAETRMTVAQLRATNVNPGAPVDDANSSADRGNLAQVANQALVRYDLGLLTDRVDYSAETGKIVAVVSQQAVPGTLYVLVNDNGTDDNFAHALDRIDTLTSVEQVVASTGGGVIDLTGSGKALQLTFSRNFSTTLDVDATKDREAHRIELVDLVTGLPLPTGFVEFRDAGGSSTLTQPTAAWTTVQGSDRDETLIFTAAESTDTRLDVLRGGNNAVRFGELTRSILVDVAITRWIESTNPADNGNASGVVSANTTFTNGDGTTLLSPAVHTIRSHTPENQVAPGKLQLTGTLDAEDAVSFGGVGAAKVIALGQDISGSDGGSVRLAGTAAAAFEFIGFERVVDNGASDDLYIIGGLLKVVNGNPRLIDATGTNDHDGIRVGNDAVGSNSVGGNGATVNLATLNGVAPGLDFDFDVLDLSPVTATGLQLLGTEGSDDELVVGTLATLASVSGFESLVLTTASLDRGAALTLDLNGGVVKAGSTVLFSYTGTSLSASGLVFGSAGQANLIDPVAVGYTMAIVDTNGGSGGTLVGGSGSDALTGGSGNDRLRGGSGDDSIDGGTPPGGFAGESWTFPISGLPDGAPDAAHRIVITISIDGKVLTLSEAAAPETEYNDGNGAFADGADRGQITQAMVALINANLGAINAGPGTGLLAGASVDGAGSLRLIYAPGVNANDVVSVTLNAGTAPDTGTFAIGTPVNVDGGGSGGNDTYVFEATAALNGRDAIINFTAGSDKLDVTAFVGGAIATASPSINGSIGGSLAGVATAAEFIYNRVGGAISEADFAISPAAGKLVLAEGARAVVVVTADPTGASGDPANSPIGLYFVQNGPNPGLSDLSVALVGTLSGPAEPTLAQIFAALTP